MPVDKIIISSVSVRGDLGPLTVWVTKDNDSILSSVPAPPPPPIPQSRGGPYELRNNPRNDHQAQSRTSKVGRFVMSPQNWKKVYDHAHCSSPRDFSELILDTPIVLKPGQCCGIYIHSSLRSDTAIVYDRKGKSKTYDDNFISVYPGRAHVSTKVFGREPIWGSGAAWRNNREFVGRLSYGVVYKLWNPNMHYAFGGAFQRLAITLFSCQRNWESPFSALPDDCIFYILNMCRWDWVSDDYRSIWKAARKNKDRKLLAESSSPSTSNDEVLDEVNRDGETSVGGEERSVDESEMQNLDSHDGMEADEDNEGMSDGDNDSEYDEDYEEMSESDEEDLYTDHSSKRTFRFEDYDEYDSNDEAEEQDRRLEADRLRHDQRRARFWTQNHGRLVRLIMHQNQIRFLSDDDDDDDEDYEYEQS